MQYNEFIHEGKQLLGLEKEADVMQIARAFLHTLTEHMAGNAADNLAAQLPEPVAALIREITPEDRDQGQRFTLEEFYLRVAHKAHLDDATARRYTHDFMKLLGGAITEGEVEKLRKILSADYAPLFNGISGVPNAPVR
ncbi:hypothetical protein GCM10023187_56350 [Nibrella viscosa]|uniref:DUF2267 domain-containing protein n=1 Tax=Nibrella viscosa TaxID=1084524 RepID=A0ABP8L3D7_9BACT